MRLYLDDNRADPVLVDLLEKAGHDATVPADAGLVGAADARHLAYALVNSLALITADHEDFFDLHELVLAAGGGHAGILVVRFDNDPKNDMKIKHIVTAVGKLEASALPLANQWVELNHWR